MKNLSKNTGVKCITCKEGNIVEIFTLNYGQIDPGKMLIGGDNYVPTWVTGEFSCDSCGQTFKSTDKNGLKPYEDLKKIEKILLTFSEYLVVKDIPTEFILPARSDGPLIDGLSKASKVFIFREQKTYREFLDSAHNKEKDYYLYMDENAKIQLFNQRDKWAEDWKKFSEPIIKKARELAKKSKKRAETLLNKNNIGHSWHHDELWITCYTDSFPIEEPAIPNDSTLAVKIAVLDNDFNQEFYWIPKGAIKEVLE